MRNIEKWLNKVLPDDWRHNAHRYGMGFNLICPHGHLIEKDGECPEGCESPLIDMGLI